MSAGTPKQFKKLEKASTKAGWTWELRRGSKHIIVRDASGEFVIAISGSLYDGSTTKQILSTLKKRGCPGT